MPDYYTKADVTAKISSSMSTQIMDNQGREQTQGDVNEAQNTGVISESSIETKVACGQAKKANDEELAAFTSFPNLATELRLKIWRAALPGPQYIEFCWRRNPDTNGKDTAGGSSIENGTIFRPRSEMNGSLLRSLSSVCHEAREELQKQYILIGGGSYPDPYSGSQPCTSKIHFNPAIDTIVMLALEIDDSEGLALPLALANIKELRRGNKSLIQRIAIHARIPFHYIDYHADRLVTGMDGMQEITLFMEGDGPTGVDILGLEEIKRFEKPTTPSDINEAARGSGNPWDLVHRWVADRLEELFKRYVVTASLPTIKLAKIVFDEKSQGGQSTK